ncbi:hypothetical protein ACOSP7_014985 [Xanthoceras sorbifolium]
MAPPITKPGNRKLSIAANLANLLPTGITLAFQALMPSFTNNGSTCPQRPHFINHYVFLYEDDNDDNNNGTNEGEEGNRAQQQRNIDVEERGEGHHQKKLKINFKDGLDDEEKKILAKYRIRWTDFLHAFGSLLVFVLYATSSYDVQRCFFYDPNGNGKALMMNMPLAVGAY